jgi:FkbM family methyltransferase
VDLELLEMNSLKDRILARTAAGVLSHFRHTPLLLQPDDLRHMRISFSQFGEDLVIVEHLINRKKNPRGIYVDAGCFNPFRFSNTRLLNLLGWTGINIDASESAIREFNLHRPQDVNICAALSDRVSDREFVFTEGSALNRLATSDPSDPGEPTEGERVAVTTRTLQSIYESSRMAGREVDFLSIDCEGSDLAVLRGFDIQKTRPVLICIEAHNSVGSAEIHSYLSENGYSHVCDRGLSLLFRDSSTI